MSDLIEVHVEHLRAGGYAQKTVSARERILWHAEDYLPQGLDEAHPDEIAAYMASPGWSRWTRSTYWSHLFGFYSWGTKLGEFTFNPMAKLIRPPVGECLPDPVTDDELDQALRYSPDQPWRQATLLAAYAGLRCSEITQLARDDITERDIRVRRGKGGRGRVVPTHPILWEEFKRYPRGNLVTSPTGLVLTGDKLTQSQSGHWYRIGLGGVHLHRFRHWFATSLLRKGADIRTVQELLGHKSITSTMFYTQVVSEQRRFAVSTLPAPAITLQAVA